jgi:serine/threonine-protein kinase
VYAPGSILAGKYRIECVLGEGGMGMVVEATHIGLGTKVALKFLHPHLVGHQSLMERFMREARASAQLRSEHVCRVSDVGQFEDGTAYIVMELLHGSDLARIAKARGPMPPQLVIDYLLQACAGIAEAHQLRIVHRDLKPANLFVTSRPDGSPLVKVLDFGVAKAPQGDNFSLTQTSNVMGSPGYMSPEQLRSSKEADARSDVWSLGVTMYELISGRQPWAAESITELTLRIAMDPLPPLPATVPPELAAVIARCMEKDPAARYQTVAELAAALAPFGSPDARDLATRVSRVLRGSRPTISPPPADPSAPTVASATTLGSSNGAIAESGPRGRSWRWPAALGAVAAIGVAVVVVSVTRGGGGSEPAAATAPRPAPAPTPTPAPAPAPTPAPTPAPPPAPPALPPQPEVAAGSGSAGSAATTPPKKKHHAPTHKHDTKEDINDSRI